MILKNTILDFAAGTWGEDRLCLPGGLYCVLDGATPLKQMPFQGFHSSAEWLADTMAAYLQAHYTPALPYPQLCKDFIGSAAQYRDEFEASCHLPCLTTAALQHDGGLLRGWVLGDCSIYLLMGDGSLRHITDERVAYFAQKTMRVKQEALHRGEDPSEAVLAQRTQNKQMMNQPGGYWTVGFDGDFAEEFVAFSVEAGQVCAALLCTDGLDRLFLHYGVAPRELLTGKLSLQDALQVLREKERSEKSTEIKQHDDVAAILLENP